MVSISKCTLIPVQKMHWTQIFCCVCERCESVAAAEDINRNYNHSPIIIIIINSIDFCKHIPLCIQPVIYISLTNFIYRVTASQSTANYTENTIYPIEFRVHIAVCVEDNVFNLLLINETNINARIYKMLSLHATTSIFNLRSSPLWRTKWKWVCALCNARSTRHTRRYTHAVVSE